MTSFSKDSPTLKQLHCTSSLFLLIANTITSAVTTAVDAIQIKYEEKMFTLQQMIKKFLLFRNSASSTSFLDPNASDKTLLLMDLHLKTTNPWNQSDPSYFDPNLNRAYGKSKIMSVGRDVYYKNVVLFVYRFQSLVIFKEAILMKANITTFF